MSDKYLRITNSNGGAEVDLSTAVPIISTTKCIPVASYAFATVALENGTHGGLKVSYSPELHGNATIVVDSDSTGVTTLSGTDRYRELVFEAAPADAIAPRSVKTSDLGLHNDGGTNSPHDDSVAINAAIAKLSSQGGGTLIWDTVNAFMSPLRPCSNVTIRAANRQPRLWYYAGQNLSSGPITWTGGHDDFCVLNMNPRPGLPNRGTSFLSPFPVWPLQVATGGLNNSSTTLTLAANQGVIFPGIPTYTGMGTVGTVTWDANSGIATFAVTGISPPASGWGLFQPGSTGAGHFYFTASGSNVTAYLPRRAAAPVALNDTFTVGGLLTTIGVGVAAADSTEMVLVTSIDRTAGTCQILRGQCQTLPKAHAAGTPIAATIIDENIRLENLTVKCQGFYTNNRLFTQSLDWGLSIQVSTGIFLVGVLNPVLDKCTLYDPSAFGTLIGNWRGTAYDDCSVYREHIGGGGDDAKHYWGPGDRLIIHDCVAESIASQPLAINIGEQDAQEYYQGCNSAGDVESIIIERVIARTTETPILFLATANVKLHSLIIRDTILDRENTGGIWFQMLGLGLTSADQSIGTLHCENLTIKTTDSEPVLFDAGSGVIDQLEMTSVTCPGSRLNVSSGVSCYVQRTSGKYPKFIADLPAFVDIDVHDDLIPSFTVDAPVGNLAITSTGTYYNLPATPIALAVGPDGGSGGRLAVAYMYDSGSGLTQHVALFDTVSHATVAVLALPYTSMLSINSMAFDSHGNLYVGNSSGEGTSDGTIRVYSAAGAYLQSLTTGLLDVRDIRIDGNDNLYAGEFDQTGPVIVKFAYGSSSVSLTIRPVGFNGFVIGKQSNAVHVAYWNGGASSVTLDKYLPGQTSVASSANLGLADVEFNAPYDYFLASDSEGNIIAPDPFGVSPFTYISILNVGSNTVSQSTESSGPCASVAVDSANNIYVLTVINGNPWVAVYTHGSSLPTVNIRITQVLGSIAIDAGDNLYVCNPLNRVDVYSTLASIQDATNAAIAANILANPEYKIGTDAQNRVTASNPGGGGLTTEQAAQLTAIQSTVSTSPIVVRRPVDPSGALRIATATDYPAAPHSIRFGVPDDFMDLTGCTPTLDITRQVGGTPSPTPVLSLTGQLLTGTFVIEGITYTRALDFTPTATQTASLSNWSPAAYVYRLLAVWTSPAKTIQIGDPAPCTALW